MRQNPAAHQKHGDRADDGQRFHHVGRKRQNPTPQAVFDAAFRALLRQMQPQIVDFHNPPTRPYTPTVIKIAMPVSTAICVVIGWLCTVPSVMAMISADKIKSVRTAPLTAQEEQIDLHTREHRFNIPLLTRRMQDATAWAAAQPELQHAVIGYFGASTGSAAALLAAARLGNKIAAVVSRGGRPDLAGPVALAAVTAPTLLIVGGADYEVTELNEQAHAHLRCEKSLVIVPGATHLFEEAGALEQVAQLASSWFTIHLTSLQYTS